MTYSRIKGEFVCWAGGIAADRVRFFYCILYRLRCSKLGLTPALVTLDAALINADTVALTRRGQRRPKEGMWTQLTARLSSKALPLLSTYWTSPKPVLH